MMWGLEGPQCAARLAKCLRRLLVFCSSSPGDAVRGPDLKVIWGMEGINRARCAGTACYIHITCKQSSGHVTRDVRDATVPRRRVEVVHNATGRRWDFGCYGWLDVDCGFQRTLALEAYANPEPGPGSPRRRHGAAARSRSYSPVRDGDMETGPQRAHGDPYQKDLERPYAPLSMGPMRGGDAKAGPLWAHGGTHKTLRKPHAPLTMGPYAAAAAAPSEDGEDEPGLSETGRGDRPSPSPAGVRMVGRAGHSYDRSLDGGVHAPQRRHGGEQIDFYSRVAESKAFRQGETWVPEGGRRERLRSSAAYYY